LGACCLLPFVGPSKRVCETRLHRIFPWIMLFNFVIMAFTLNQLSTISFNELFFALVRLIDLSLGFLEKFLIGTAVLVMGFVFWKFKDRILETVGIESSSLLIGDFRDWATCWSMRRFQPIEIFIWKIEGLPSSSLVQSNNPFCEVALGYNTRMRTRVHHAAGHSCIFKESLQMNFDPQDLDSRMTLQVKHQASVGNEVIAQVQFGAAQIERLTEAHDTTRVLGCAGTTVAREDVSSAWSPSRFRGFDLVPTGRIHLRFSPLPMEDLEDMPGGGCMDALCCCCPKSEPNVHRRVPGR